MAKKPPPIALSDIDPQVASDVSAICTAYRTLQVEIKTLDDSKRKLYQDVTRLGKQIFAHRKSSSLDGGAWWLLRVEKSRKTLSREKLLQLGVPMGVIEAATETTDTVEYHVRGKKEDI